MSRKNEINEILITTSQQINSIRHDMSDLERRLELVGMILSRAKKPRTRPATIERPMSQTRLSATFRPERRTGERRAPDPRANDPKVMGLRRPNSDRRKFVEHRVGDRRLVNQREYGPRPGGKRCFNSDRRKQNHKDIPHCL